MPAQNMVHTPPGLFLTPRFPTLNPSAEVPPDGSLGALWEGGGLASGQRPLPSPWEKATPSHWSTVFPPSRQLPSSHPQVSFPRAQGRVECMGPAVHPGPLGASVSSSVQWGEAEVDRAGMREECALSLGAGIACSPPGLFLQSRVGVEGWWLPSGGLWGSPSSGAPPWQVASSSSRLIKLFWRRHGEGGD